MTKKVLNHNTIFEQNFISTFEENFLFSDKSINRFKFSEHNSAQNIRYKAEKISVLKNQINSIENCSLKTNSNNLILGGGNVNSPIMLVGEAPGGEEDKSGLVFQGEVGKLLTKMLKEVSGKCPAQRKIFKNGMILKNICRW